MLSFVLGFICSSACSLAFVMYVNHRIMRRFTMEEINTFFHRMA